MGNFRRVNLLGLFLFLSLTFIISIPGNAAEEKKEILVGAPISLTGIVSMSGQEQKWAYEQAIADVNKSGGIYLSKLDKKLPVKLIVADDQSEPGKASAAMEKLIKLDKVDVLLSNQAAPLVVPACIVAEKYKKFMQSTVCFPFMWSPNKFKWSSLMFFKAPMAAEVPFKIWESLPEDQRPQKPALLVEDTPDGEGFGGGFKNFAEQYGYKFVVAEPMAVGAKDYGSQVLKLKFKKADAVFLFGSPSDSVTFVRQMLEMGVKVKYLHGWKGTWTHEFSTALGEDANGILCDGFWSEDLPYPGARELGQRYYENYKKHSVSIGLFYANAQILLKAIEKAGTYDSAAVRDAVVGGEFKDTVMGDIKYDETGLAVTFSTALQWQDGKQMLVYPPVEGGYELKMQN
jgi:branched-chain amino acid transport system substrate-binding protein